MFSIFYRSESCKLYYFMQSVIIKSNGIIDVKIVFRTHLWWPVFAAACFLWELINFAYTQASQFFLHCLTICRYSRIRKLILFKLTLNYIAIEMFWPQVNLGNGECRRKKQVAVSQKNLQSSVRPVDWLTGTEKEVVGISQQNRLKTPKTFKYMQSLLRCFKKYFLQLK